MFILLSTLSASFANKNEQNVATPNNLIIKFQIVAYLVIIIRYNIKFNKFVTIKYSMIYRRLINTNNRRLYVSRNGYILLILSPWNELYISMFLDSVGLLCKIKTYAGLL